MIYGDEVGMTGAGDSGNRRDMRFGEGVSAPERGVMENFEKLARIRTRHPAMRYGSRRALVAEKDLLAFVRAHFADRALCVFNRGNKSVERELAAGPELADGACVDELSGATATVRRGRMKVSVGPRSAAFFVTSAGR